MESTHRRRRLTSLVRLRMSGCGISLAAERVALSVECEQLEHALPGSVRLLAQAPEHDVGRGYPAAPSQSDCQPHPTVPRYEPITDRLGDIAPLFSRQL